MVGLLRRRKLRISKAKRSIHGTMSSVHTFNVNATVVGFVVLRRLAMASIFVKNCRLPDIRRWQASCTQFMPSGQWDCHDRRHWLPCHGRVLGERERRALESGVAAIQAPSRNLLAPTITKVTPVARAPTAFTMALGFHPLLRSRRQCITIPTCDNVQAKNTPTANSGIKAWLLPEKTTINTAAEPARSKIPFEKTDREFNFMSRLGRKPSPAMTLMRRGKPAKLVFAPTVRRIMVETWMMR